MNRRHSAQGGFIGILVALVAVLIVAGGTYLLLHVGPGLGFKQPVPEQDSTDSTVTVVPAPSSVTHATSTSRATTTASHSQPAASSTSSGTIATSTSHASTTPATVTASSTTTVSASSTITTP